MIFGILTLGLIATFASANTCVDRIPPQYCQLYRRLCFSPRVGQYLCRRTCGNCRVTERTTKAPIPVIPTGTQGPLPSCGISIVQQARVIGGENAKIGAWPWQIAMYINGYFACGGSLVTPSWIVTAAHCVQRYHDPAMYTIILGNQDLRRRGPWTQRRNVIRIVSHPGYGRMNNDIALMKLSRPAILNDRVRTVCLPKAGDGVPVGTKCYITGFGKIKHPGRSHPVLQQANLAVVSQKTCAALNTKFSGIKIQPEMVCAGYGPSDIRSGCHGDSGGPFVCQYGNGNAFTLQGAVSWGSPHCNTRESYSVFARISSFRTWIDRYIYQ